jgi:hypothetical protein
MQIGRCHRRRRRWRRRRRHCRRRRGQFVCFARWRMTRIHTCGTSAVAAGVGSAGWVGCSSLAVSRQSIVVIEHHRPQGTLRVAWKNHLPMRRPKLADDSYLHGFDWYWTSMVLTGIGLLCPAPAD